jgi:hypothetical protein
MGRPVKVSDRNRPWTRLAGKRRHGTRPERRFFLIVCEGQKTEPNYFRAIGDALPRGTVRVEVHGEGMNTLSLVRRAGEIADGLKRNGSTVDRIWVVFDRDSFEADDFDNAISSARSRGFGVAWSNEAFELWYVLHFEARTAAMSRDEFQGRLSRHLRRTYRKNAPDMYRLLRDRTAVASENAARLVAQSEGTPPHDANPCTRVHELVAELETQRLP